MVKVMLNGEWLKFSRLRREPIPKHSPFSIHHSTFARASPQGRPGVIGQGPDTLVELIDQIRIRQQEASLACGERYRASRERSLEQCRPGGTDRRLQRSSLTEEHAVQRVDVRVDDGAHEAVAFGRPARAAASCSAALRSLIEIAQLRAVVRSPRESGTGPRRGSGRRAARGSPDTEIGIDRISAPMIGVTHQK